MHKVQIFQNADFGEVRVAMQEGEPLFCAYDVCRILQYENGRDTILKFFPKGVARIKTPTNGGLQELTYLTEPQLYKLIMRSHAKNAEPLQDWVCYEVLPTIRKRGQYSLFQEPVAPTHQIPKSYAEALLEAGRLAMENEKLLAQAKEDAPKVECYNALMESNDCLDFSRFAKSVGVGRNILFRNLREMGVLMSDNLPYQEYMDRGYFRVVEGTYNNGGYNKIYQRTLITPKGQDYIQKRIRDFGAIVVVD